MKRKPIEDHLEQKYPDTFQKLRIAPFLEYAQEDSREKMKGKDQKAKTENDLLD